MHREQIEKNWNQLKNHVAKQWNKLSAEDLYQIDGMYDKFVAKIVKRYNCTTEVAEKQIQNWQPKMEGHSPASYESNSEFTSSHPSHDNKSNKNKKTEMHDFKHADPEPKHKESKDWQNHSEGKDKKRKAS